MKKQKLVFGCVSLARKICDKLEVEDTRLIFPDGSIHYPDFQTADKFEQLNTREEKPQHKDVVASLHSHETNDQTN